MKKRIIFSDVHMYGPLAIDVNWEYEKNCVYLGDNVDVTGSLAKDSELVYSALRFYRNKFGDRFCSGNHEAYELNPHRYQDGNILFCHGDDVFWGRKKSHRFRCKEGGNGGIVDKLWQLFIDRYVAVFNYPLFPSVKKRILSLAETWGVNTIVMGHTHPKKLRKFKVGKVTVYVVPRGRTELYL